MRAFIFGVAALLTSSSLACADDIMAGYYGNTIVATTSMSELHIHYHADRTFDAAGSDAAGAVSFKGKWFIDAKSQLCRDYDVAPPGRPNTVCTPWAAHKIDDAWTMPGVTLTLVEGLQ